MHLSQACICCVEAECHFCYLRDSSVYVHESFCLGVQRHLPTYMKRRKCQDGPETYMKQIWYLISVTTILKTLEEVARKPFCDLRKLHQALLVLPKDLLKLYQ